MSLAKGATLPQGKVSLRMARLDDLRGLTGQAVSGALTADASLDGSVATVDIDATRAGIPGSAVGHAVLKARVSDPLAHPTVAATLDAEGIEAAESAARPSSRCRASRTRWLCASAPR